MNEHDDITSASPEDIKSAIRGWTVLTVLVAAVLGVAYVMAEM